MTLDSAQAWVLIIGAVFAGIAHLIAAWRCRTAEKEYRAATAAALDSIPAAPGDAPGFSINSLLRFYDLYARFSLAWGAVRGLKPQETALLPSIKAKVDGRYYQIGDGVIPVTRLD